MAIEKVNTAHREAQPTVISMELLRMWLECNQRQAPN
jgi:hypothetical protein